MDQTKLNDSVENIAAQLRNCDLDTLCALEPVLKDLIKEIETSVNQGKDTGRRERRREERFATELTGTLTRLSDISPGEKREYPVKIQDLSRQGMRIEIDADYIPSRINRITFIGFGGKVKEIHMKIARMQKRVDDDNEWLSLGCRMVSKEEVRLVRQQEEKAQLILNKLNRKEVKLLLVGKPTKESAILRGLIEKEGYSYQSVHSVHQAVELIDQDTFELILFTEWDSIFKDASLVDRINGHTQKQAKVALIKPEHNQAAFLESGIDVCLPHCNDRGILTQALERALTHHLSKEKEKSCEVFLRSAVLICNDTETTNLLSYLFKEYQYSSQVFAAIDQVKPKVLAEMDLLFVQFDPQNSQTFLATCQRSKKAPAIAVCQNVEQGHQAIANGAKDFLTLPPKKNDFQMILDKWVSSKTQA